MVKPEVAEDNMILLAHDLAKKIESELEYPARSRSTSSAKQKQSNTQNKTSSARVIPGRCFYGRRYR